MVVRAIAWLMASARVGLTSAEDDVEPIELPKIARIAIVWRA